MFYLGTLILCMFCKIFRYQEDRKAHEGQKWKLPPCGQPISLFSSGNDTSRTIIMPQDDSE